MNSVVAASRIAFRFRVERPSSAMSRGPADASPWFVIVSPSEYWTVRFSCGTVQSSSYREDVMSDLAQATIKHTTKRTIPQATIVETVSSADGTTIAFERRGQGPPLIFVRGAPGHRAMGPSPPLARLLAESFTVFTYDRRGRGASGDTKPYAVEREIEDLQALIRAAGGSVFVWGISSGAALALEATRHGSAISK